MRFYKQKILQKYPDSISDISDLTAGDKPSMLFYFLTYFLGYLLSNDTAKAVSENGIRVRNRWNPLLKKAAGNLLTSPQYIENRNLLRNPEDNTPDTQIMLPDTPVIWASNHAFKDDGLASVLAIQRHAYILFGSLPQFFNTIDGVTAWLNGVVMVNRKMKESRHACIGKAVKVMECGADLLMFPEGVWNKSPNRLLLDLWPGIWRIAKETGAPIVPMVHYIKDCTNSISDNPIHTVIDDPIKIDDLSERAGLDYVREILAYWFYLMMETYGKSTREEEIKGYVDPGEVWKASLTKRSMTLDRYDDIIEKSADYRHRESSNPAEVWKYLAMTEKVTIQNAPFVAYANMVLEDEFRNDFQHRF